MSHAEPVSPERARALAKPPVRKLAKDLGVDLGTVTPTGEGGIVTRADVEAAAAGGAVRGIRGNRAVRLALGSPAGAGERRSGCRSRACAR